ncbi:MAG: type II secretion system F family protein [Candidatus Harrisonbacteria bacterium]|nr:type II secretion system F family protein [Candidatus Harrisonbacteria bacterium]
MPKFHYVASAQNGKIEEGNADAKSTAELLEQLVSKGLKPVSIKLLKGDEALSQRKTLFGKKITLTDQIFLTKYLSIMLRVGTDLLQAINILIADFEKPALRALLIEIREGLERGQPFYSTFARYPQYFSPVFINLVKAGESSGGLEQAFTDLNETLTKEKDLRSRIRGALIYPSLLFTLSIGILIFLTTFALPRLANVFSGGGFEPPAFSRVVFAVGLFINDNIWIVLGIFFGLIALTTLFLRSHTGRETFQRIRTHIPFISRVINRLAIQRFARTFAALMKSGMPIMNALEISANTVNHVHISKSILRVREKVSQGISLGEAFRQESSFPFVISNLIAIAERSGHLEEVLETVANFYESEVEAALQGAVSVLEPLLLLIIGGVIGIIALAIIVPVYQLVGQL